MTDADFYDRISGAGQEYDRCPRCFGRGWLRTPASEDYDCPACEGTGEMTPGRRRELGLPPA
jgi:DnaJ-class molecular chaperone